MNQQEWHAYHHDGKYDKDHVFALIEPHWRDLLQYAFSLGIGRQILEPDLIVVGLAHMLYFYKGQQGLR